MSRPTKNNENSTKTKVLKHNTNISAALSLSSSSSLPPKYLSSLTALTSSSLSSTSTLALSSNMTNSSLLFDKKREQFHSMSATDQVTSLEAPQNNDNKINFKRVSLPSFKIMSYQHIIGLLTILLCGLATVNGLKCFMCGEYNEGVGSITPCSNYSEQNSILHLRECPKKSDKYCVKYISQLSTVRDCATECAEKDVWETQTYCCTDDGCNHSASIKVTSVIIIGPIVAYLWSAIWNGIRKFR